MFDCRDCPTQQELAGAAANKLPQDQLVAIAEHLNHCPSCVVSMWDICVPEDRYTYKYTCPDPRTLVNYVRNRLHGDQKSSVAVHCLGCGRCLSEVGALQGLPDISAEIKQQIEMLQADRQSHPELAAQVTDVIGHKLRQDWYNSLDPTTREFLDLLVSAILEYRHRPQPPTDGNLSSDR